LLLTDLLSRYLSVLTSSCARYAHHAGRLNLTVKDALSALNDMGVNVDELAEYCKSEGKEFSRYAVQTARRLEDLREMKGQLTPICSLQQFTPFS
jgi:Wiskott-Aldrich syndrome protein